jgi:ABC-type sugar transport system substrate-binding protein
MADGNGSAATIHGSGAIDPPRNAARWAQAAAAAALALMLTTAGALAQDASKGKKVLLVESDVAHPYVAAEIEAFKTRAAHWGMDATVQAAGFDAALQSRQVDDGIARNFPIIAVQADSEQAIIPALARAKQAKIPILMVNNPPKDNTEAYYLSYIGQDQTEMGRIAARSILQALKASGRTKAKVALITGSLQEGAAPRRVTGIEEVLKTDPDVQVVAVEDAKWDTALSERVAGQLYARFAPQGGLDAVYGMADNQAVAAIRAAQAAGIPVGLGPKQLLVFGGNCLKEGLDAIAAGRMVSTVLQDPKAVGIATADAMNQYFSGKTLAKQILTQITTIDKANLATYRDACTY